MVTNDYARWGWFTLTELQERLNISDRHTLLRSTVNRGAPHVPLGRETVFAQDSFVKWLLDRETVKTAAAAELEEAVA